MARPLVRRSRCSRTLASPSLFSIPAICPYPITVLICVEHTLIPMRRINHSLKCLHVHCLSRMLLFRPVRGRHDANTQTVSALEIDNFAYDFVGFVQG